MDREQEEMQFLGLFDIYIEAYRVIYQWKKIFSQITLSLILPMSFIFLAHMEVYHLFFSDLKHSESQLRHTHTGTAKYNKISDHIDSELTSLWLFIIVYFTILIIFSLLSTSAVVYTIASIYTSREVGYKKVMSVVPKVWKRVMSYHHENIDKSALSDHLEVYLGEYEPLKSQDVQMESYQV
ncbi:hypothetical protein AABB24_028414 [Solanum stoloniferum]|uniref:Uncharacterized protein n=1 Tax=Solanum stoloniferum TaxID=62892 RepID=A0ABD2S834_9SOLN